MIEQQGITLLGIAVANLDDGDHANSCCRSIVGPAARSTPRSTTSATASAAAAVTRAARLGTDPGITVPLLPD